MYVEQTHATKQGQDCQGLLQDPVLAVTTDVARPWCMSGKAKPWTSSCRPVGGADDYNPVRARGDAVKLDQELGLQPPAGFVLAGTPLGQDAVDFVCAGTPQAGSEPEAVFSLNRADSPGGVAMHL